MNEELPISSENRETSREELQSLNEELSTANNQLEDKVRELESTNNDLNNLLSSTDIATIFLDTKLLIRRFTPATLELMNMIPSDIGRPFSDIAPRFTDGELLADARQVLESHQPLEREVQNGGNRAFNRRIVPYRTHDNRIEGVVITFSDVTELRQQADQIRCREQQQAVVAELGQKALSRMKLPKLLEVACREVARVLEVPLTKVLKLLPDGKRLVLKAGAGWGTGLVGKATVSAGLNSQAGFTLNAKSPVIVTNLRKEKRFRGPRFLTEHDVVSGISTIIGSRDQPWGVFGAHTTEVREFTMDDVNFIQAVANVLSESIERTRSEKELAVSERFKSRIISASLNGLYIYDCDAGRNSFINEQYTVLTGYTLEELQRMNRGQFLDLFHPDDLPAVTVHMEQIAHSADGETLEIEYRFLRKGGRWIWCLSRDTVFSRRDDGSVKSFIGGFIDLTERKEYEQQVRSLNEELSKNVDERTEELRVLSENVPALFAYIDKEETYQYVNPRYEEKIGSVRSEIVGKRVEDVLRSEFYDRIQGYIKGVLQGHEQAFDLSIRSPSGVTQWIHAVYVPHFDPEGNVIGFFALINDLTKQRELQREVLRILEEEKIRVAHDLHDDLGGLLSGIDCLTKVIQDDSKNGDLPKPEITREVCELTRKAIRQTRNLARGLRAVEPEPTGLMTSLRELADRVDRTTQLACRFEEPSHPVLIEDANSANHLYRIAQEAVTNAVRHSDASKVVIRLKESSDGIRLTIDDDGKGLIPVESRDKTGMGLRIMRHRADEIGASLEFGESKTGGTEISCLLLAPLKK